MDHELQSKIAGIVRTALAALAASQFGRKWLDDTTANLLINAVVGLIPVLVGYWSWRQKKKQNQIVEAAIEAPPNATVADVVAEVKASS